MLPLTVGHSLEAEHASTARQEMTSIIVGVKADQITVQNTEQNVFSDWQCSDQTDQRACSVILE